MGCVTLEVPRYLEGEFQYKKEFNSNFNDTFAATVKALESLGWKIANTENMPFLEKEATDSTTQKHQSLIFTEIKQRSLFIFSTYLTLNVYVKSASDTTSEVDVRYLSITALPPFFKEWRVNKNEGLVNKIYKKIAHYLTKPS